MTKRINGRQSRPYVQRREAFKNSNGQLYAEWIDGPAGSLARYVVYSYGPHWPLFIYVPHVSTWFENKDKYNPHVNTWFENKDRHSPTTSKHRTFTHPHCETVALTCHQMKLLERLGYSSLVNDRLMGGNTNG